MSFAGIDASALVPTFGRDVVAIYRQVDGADDTLVLEGAHLIQANVDESSVNATHPLETGENIVDHRIIQPVEIELRVILVDKFSALGGLGQLAGIGTEFSSRARDVYKEMRELFLEGTFLSIQTRTDIYPNQVLRAMPHEESSRMFDGVTISVGSSEVQFELGTSNFAPADATQTDTVGRGKQNLLSVAADTATSVVTRAAGILGV